MSVLDKSGCTPIYEAALRSEMVEAGVQDPVLSAQVAAQYIFELNKKKLTSADVRAIRLGHRNGETQLSLAERFGVNPATVSRIVRGLYH